MGAPATTDPFHFFEDIFSQIDGPMTTYISDTVSNVAAGFAPFANQLMLMYVALWGWSVMRGLTNELVLDGAIRIVKMVLIVSMAIQTAVYNEYIADWLWLTPDAIGAVLTGSPPAGSSVNALDQLMDSIYAVFLSFWDAALADSSYGIPNLSLALSGLAALVLGFLSTIYAAFLMALGKIGLAVLLAIGPIFVLGLLFDATKGFFQSWLNQLMNAVFVFVLAVAVAKLIMSINQTYIATLDLSSPELPSALPIIAISVMSFLVLMQVPSIASALGGGVAINTLGAVGWAMRKAGATAQRYMPREMARRRMDNARIDRWRERNPSMASRAASATTAKAVGLYRKVVGIKHNSVSKAA